MTQSLNHARSRPEHTTASQACHIDDVLEVRVTNEQLEALVWLCRKDGDGVELWEFPLSEELPAFLSKGLVSIGATSGDQRTRVRLTDKGQKVLDNKPRPN